MYQARDTGEEQLIKRITSGNSADCQTYAKELVRQGKPARVARLHLDRAVLHAPWRVSLDGRWPLCQS